MAKQEDVKKIELKVSVNCCEGCRKKVTKALSIKGVLKADIHPTLPKVTVLGNVDPRILLKRLAKRGKTAELWPVEPEKQEKEENKSETAENREAAVVSNKTSGKEEVKAGGDGAKPALDHDNNEGKPSDSPSVNGDCDKGEKKSAETCISGSTANGSPPGIDQGPKNINSTCAAAASVPTAVTALPRVDYVVNPRVVDARAQYSPVYYTVQPYPVPVTAYPAAVPACFTVRDQSYHPLMLPPPSLPSQFGDYFSEENAVGCHVM